MKTPAILLRQVLITFQKRVWWIFNWSNQEFCERRYSCFGRRAIQPSPGVSISVWGFKYASLLFIGSVIRGYYRFLSGVCPPNIYYFVCNQNYCQHKISQHIHIRNGPQKISVLNFHMNTQVHHTSTDRILCIDLYDLYAEKETKWPNIQMVNLVTTCALRSWCLFEAEPALRLQSQTLDHSSHT